MNFLKKTFLLSNLILTLHFAPFSMADNTADNPQEIKKNIGLDTLRPFGTLPRNQMPIALLENKENYIQPITFGGTLEYDLQNWGGSYQKTNPPTYHEGTSGNLAHTYLFTLASLNTWSQVFFSYHAIGNQEPQIGRLFLLLGNLSKTPFYASIGYTYLPFRVYSPNEPLNNTLPNNLYSVLPTNQISINYDANGFMVNAALFDNDKFDHNLSDFLLNSTYTYKFNIDLSTILGAAYLNDVRGTKSGLGFSFSPSGQGTENAPFTNNSAVGIYQISAQINYKNLSLLSEFDNTTHSAISNSQKTGLLEAYAFLGTYEFQIEGKSTKANLSYSATKNMALVNMPLFGNYGNGMKSNIGMKSLWLGNIQYEALKNTYLGPALSYTTLYNQTHTWTMTMDLTAYF